ncbi:MAG TPA: hypothetical protein GXX49_08385 [Clostridiaceae bacterium]|nr:hypothetical protein [Clostridiaceae bacterium]
MDNLNMIDDIENQVDKTVAMEWLINKLNGVISSRVVTNEKDEIIEMHILANYTRSPKQIVRDIQSALAAVYDLEIDHRIISIAQIDDGLEAPKSNDLRLKLNNIQVTADEFNLEVKVVLSLKDKLFEGKATGVNSAAAKPHIVTEATIDAIHTFLGRKNVFSVVDVKKININELSAYIVVTCFINSQQNEMLIGASLLKNDEYYAIIRAALDSVNRILSKVSEKN